MLERIRRRLTLGYAAIFALILAFLSVVAVAGFASEMTGQVLAALLDNALRFTPAEGGDYRDRPLGR